MATCYPRLHPLCIVCESLIGFEEMIHAAETYATGEPEIDLDNSVGRGSFYRAVYQLEKDSPYQLSGVGRLNWPRRNWFSVPANTNKTFHTFSSTDENTIWGNEVNFVCSHNRDSPYPHGYRIHMWCWCLIKKIIGEPAEENLDLLIETIQERWRENPTSIEEYIRNRHPLATLFPLQPDAWTRPLRNKQLHDIHAKDLAKIRKMSETVANNVVSIRDPHKIPDIENVIKRCMWNYTREETKRKTRKWCSNPLSEEPLERLKLPLDVRFIILDYLDYKDIRKVLLAFGWQIPDLYWRSRYPYHIIYEFRDMVSSPAELDWKTLCLTTEEMLETVPELLNRRRIFLILQDTKECFNAKKDLD